MASNHQQGFTLVELVVVIAIIAILAAIVLINVAGYVQKANIVAIKADMNSLEVASASYIQSNSNTDFSNICADSSFVNTTDSIIKIGLPAGTHPVCIDSDTTSLCTSSQWKYDVYLPDGNVDLWCVDSLGNAQVPTYQSGACDCNHDTMAS